MEFLNAIEGFSPWNLLASYNDFVMKDATVAKTFGEISNDKGALYAIAFPAVKLYEFVQRDFLTQPWPWTAVLILQVTLGVFVTFLGMVKLVRDVGESSEIFVLGIFIILPFTSVLLGSVAAIPLWIIALIAIKLLGAILWFAGLVSYACTYLIILKLILENLLDLIFDPYKEKLSKKLTNEAYKRRK